LGYGALPLGSNSTFLNTVVQIGAAPSRSWGLWTGSRSIRNPIDGLLTIGGYDRARVQGDLSTFQMFDDCPTCVVISEMTYDYPGGSSSLFPNSSETFDVSLEPFERGIQVPQDVFESFARASNGMWDSSLGLLTYSAANPPSGNISVTLSNGYTTIIPSEELFVMPRLYSEEGVYSISNDTIIISELANYTAPGYVASWGIPYLTMNYMVVDYDEGSFKMAPAFRESFGEDGGSVIENLCTPGISTTPSPSPAPSVIKHTPTGAIAGGVVGGVGGLALIAGLLYFVFFRKRKRSIAGFRQRGPASSLETSQMPWTGKPELSSSTDTRQPPSSETSPQVSGLCRTDKFA
jgi:hypothetical protein